MDRVAFSCVYDPSPRYDVQLRIWIVTLLELAVVSPSHIIVHLLSDVDNSEAKQFLESRGVRTRQIARFLDGTYCNKIAQLDATAFEGFDYVAFCDLDLAFCAPIDCFIGLGDVVAKPVDMPNPPIEILNELYRRAGFDTRPPITRCSNSAASTYTNNCNGGLYIIRTNVLSGFAARWERWARWVMQQRDLLGAHIDHVDQISFGMAVWESGTDVAHLAYEGNVPTHLPADGYPETIGSPLVLHYHHNLALDLTLNPIGIPIVDERIDYVNATLRREQHASFDNRSFWNYRYAHHMERGSGVGSRGSYAAEKRRLLRSVIDPEDCVLDVGCGDLIIVGDLAIDAYTGVDVSSEAIRLARELKPRWSFVAGDFRNLELAAADVVICLDVLIHEPDFERYLMGITRLASLTRRRLIISGYNQEPWYTSPITYYHESLSASLRRCGRFSTLEIVGGYRDTTVFCGVP